VYVSDCRPSVCVNDGDLLWLLDSATGEVRWYGRMDGFFPAAPGVLNAGLHDTPGYSLLRDSRTGEVLGLVRSPSATIATRSAELDLVLSDGVRSVTRRVVAR
jgi:hypothetical protein